MVIVKNYHFYAGHRNVEAGTKCGRLHGHTYGVTVHIDTGEQDIPSGVTMLFSDIDDVLEPLIKYYDHYFLVDKHDLKLVEMFESYNEPFRLMDFPTSAENMAKHIFNKAKETLNIIKIELAETKSSTVVYEGK